MTKKCGKNDILSNRDKAQRLPGQSLDSKGVQVSAYKDVPSNQRPAKDDAPASGKAASDETAEPVEQARVRSRRSKR